MIFDKNDPELIHGMLENIYITIGVYKQKERDNRIAANADRGVFYTVDKDRFTFEADKYKKLINELNDLKHEIVSFIVAQNKKC
jgi:hypothetical protein